LAHLRVCSLRKIAQVRLADSAFGSSWIAGAIAAL
jgi:hypothetical protein